MWHFCNFTQPDGTHLMPCLINLNSCIHALPPSLSHLFFFLFKHIWIKPNFFKESIVYQNQTYSRANNSNLKKNPTRKHKFGPGNSLIKLQNLENLYRKKKKQKRLLILERDRSLLRYKKQKNEDSNIEVIGSDLRSNQTKTQKKKRKKKVKGILVRHGSGMRNIAFSHVQLGMVGKMAESTLSSAMSMITDLCHRGMTEEILRCWVTMPMR